MIIDRESAEDVARSALPHYGPKVSASLTFVKYRENYVFKVVDETGRSYALRLHRGGYRSDEELLEELTLLASLSASGLQVPQVRRTVAGMPFCHVVDAEGDIHQVDMLDWVEGASPLGDIGDAFLGLEEVDASSFSALGRLIADLHLKVSGSLRPESSVRRAWDADGLIGSAPLWGDPLRLFEDLDAGGVVVAEAATKLHKQLTAYGKNIERYGMVHADFTPENVLVRDGQMTIIDFDDSGPGYYVFDLATAAFFYLPHRRGEEIVASLLAGYEEVRPLTDVDRSIWKPMLLARGLTYLGWAAERPGDPTSDFIAEHVRPFVVRLAQDYMGAAELV
ncbi:Ser/Thr protein kinase RdoA involved in Cpx stress response, MazF antagonist [Actinokineospora alba]|uniref:Ser/Thr protein kinase RdoA involved in Cpx stress response, MazF antagonist n=1 Tax=Actinokineospora alba TaxID=504798 RepID=A0A1H0L6P8_9PSEU|nr:phosphotransferase [Actinokineospora alba]TDP67214.1 Ser/Thr protein kinase RdoA (MazF antagonist) [Actinokineospora alba]SDJ04229.1 Ser/Thr protein kinase RdoA involved in Cpx stress response, MazF antagonist [Actinokineospora alba]SDO63651.1 Ser/Thr protein kinase RdoA involved in Cpx stress response, MazF antagonist [Actinokineospora alba]